MIPRERYGPDDVIRALKRRRWAVIIPLWVVIVATVLLTRSLPNRYESDVRIQLVAAAVNEKVVQSAVTSTLDARLPAITELVLNGDRLRQIVNDLNLYQPERTNAAVDPVARLRGDFRIKVASVDSFTLTYASNDPRTAKAGAERLGAAFIDENRRRSEQVASAATDFLDTQLADARSRLEENEQQLAEFNRQNTGELPSQLQSNLQLLQAAQAQFQALVDTVSRDRDELQGLERQLVEIDGTPQQVEEAARTPPVEIAKPADGSAAQLLQAANQELRDLQSRLKPEHPDVIRMKRRVAELEVQARAETPAVRPATAGSAPARAPSTLDMRDSQLRGNRERLLRRIATEQADEARLKDQIDSYRHHIDAIPGHESELTALMRDYSTLKDLYSKLLAKKEDAQVSAHLQQDDIGQQFVLVEPARVPAQPVSPNRRQIDFVGAMGGLLLGLGFAAFLEVRDTSLRSAQDIEATVGLPLLAAVPIMLTATERDRHRWKHVTVWLATTSALVATVGILWRVAP